MILRLSLFVSLLLLSQPAIAHGRLFLQPSYLRTTQENLVVKKELRIDMRGPFDVRVQDALEDLSRHFEQLYHVHTCIMGHDNNCNTGSVLTLHWQHRDTPDASYHLSIDAHGISVDAQSPLGILDGLTTMQQWAQGSTQAVMQYVDIDDTTHISEAFLDLASDTISVDCLKQKIDHDAALKIHVVYAVLNSNNHFYMASKYYPKLALNDMYYTQTQIKDIVSYAYLHGIRLIPTIDLLFLSNTISSVDSNLSSASQPFDMGVQLGFYKATLDPTRSTTYTFVDDLLEEIAAVFSDTCINLIHADISSVNWLENPNIVAFMRQHHILTKDALNIFFWQRVIAIAAHYHKTIVNKTPLDLQHAPMLMLHT